MKESENDDIYDFEIRDINSIEGVTFTSYERENKLRLFLANIDDITEDDLSKGKVMITPDSTLVFPLAFKESKVKVSINQLLKNI